MCEHTVQEVSVINARAWQTHTQSEKAMLETEVCVSVTFKARQCIWKEGMGLLRASEKDNQGIRLKGECASLSHRARYK